MYEFRVYDFGDWRPSEARAPHRRGRGAQPPKNWAVFKPMCTGIPISEREISLDLHAQKTVILTCKWSKSAHPPPWDSQKKVWRPTPDMKARGPPHEPKCIGLAQTSNGNTEAHPQVRLREAQRRKFWFGASKLWSIGLGPGFMRFQF